MCVGGGSFGDFIAVGRQGGSEDYGHSGPCVMAFVVVLDPLGERW